MRTYLSMRYTIRFFIGIQMLLFICVVSDYTIMSARKWSLRVSLFIVCALNSYEKLLSLKETVRICYHFVNCKWKSVDVIRISEQLMILLPLKEKVSISIFDWMEFWKGESFIVDWYTTVFWCADYKYDHENYQQGHFDCHLPRNLAKRHYSACLSVRAVVLKDG